MFLLPAIVAGAAEDAVFSVLVYPDASDEHKPLYNATALEYVVPSGPREGSGETALQVPQGLAAHGLRCDATCCNPPPDSVLGEQDDRG